VVGPAGRRGHGIQFIPGISGAASQ
jgi:hypothetical protein